MDKAKNTRECYNDDMKDVTTDISGFEEIISYDLLYIDKTKYIYDLVGSMARRFFFLSRPRRFGKSLFCSTLHALFDGRKDLFKGLYIAEETDYSFEKYPVLHFNFANLSKISYEAFERNLQKMVATEALKAAGITDLERTSPSQMLWEAIQEIAEKTGKKVVIIIDEYDDPLVKAILGDYDYIDKMGIVFNDFFSVIKNSNEYIRFFFITGCVKLSNLSIFSAMNNLYDISMEEDFAGAFGYTEDEVERFFGEGMDEYLAANPGKYESREEFIGKIRDYYDGYRFSPDSETRTYNPVSIGRFFTKLKCNFRSYWEQTGLTLLAVQTASKYDISSLFDIDDIKMGTKVEASVSAFTNFSLTRLNDKSIGKDAVFAMLYYSGYLTLSGVDFRTYILGFPNIEVHSAFINGLVSEYAGTEGYMDVWITHFHKACATGNADTVMEEIENYFQCFPYDIVSRWKEAVFQGIFHSIFVVSSMLISSEERGLIGRSDEVLIASNHIWIFELKINGNAEDALEQIKKNRYEGKYLDYSRTHKMEIHLVGINMDTKERKLSWVSG